MRQRCEPTLFHFFLDAMWHVFDWLFFLTRKCFGSCSALRLFHSSKLCCHQTNWAWCETSKLLYRLWQARENSDRYGCMCFSKNKFGVIDTRKKKNQWIIALSFLTTRRWSCSNVLVILNLMWIYDIYERYNFSYMIKKKKDKNCNSCIGLYWPECLYMPAFTVRMIH